MHTLFITKASTNVSVELEIIDSTAGTPETGVLWNTAGIDLQYRRDGAVSTAITEATLAALTTAHTDGGFLHIGNGVYRFDVPDLAFATGVDKVIIHGTVTGMIVIPCLVQLIDVDLQDTVRMGLTSLPNAAADAAGGLAISDAGGLALDGLATATAVADVPTVSEFNARTLVAASYFDPAVDTVANVTLVATTTTNTDMRGTDNAATATALATVDTEVGLIQADLDNATDGLGAIKAETALIVADTNELQVDDIPAKIAALDAVVDTVKAETALIVADTNELQGDWANAGRLDAILDSRMAEASINTTTGAIDVVTLVTTTTTNTDMRGTESANTVVPDAAGVAPTAIENADALLNRDMATGTDSGSPTVRTVRQALRFLRNKWSVSGTTLTVTKEDDTTATWTSTVSTDAAADPVTGSDPA